MTSVLETLRLLRRLREAGEPAEKARAMAEAIGDGLSGDLATKADLTAFRAELMGKVQANPLDRHLHPSLRRGDRLADVLRRRLIQDWAGVRRCRGCWEVHG